MKLKFKGNFEVKQLKPDLVFLISEEGNFVLKGHIYYLLVPLLDGSRTASQIINELHTKASFLKVNYAISRLKKKGYIVEVNDDIPPNIKSLSYIFNIPAQRVRERLKSKSVFATSLGNTSSEQLINHLKKAHIQLCSQADKADLVVVQVADYLQPELDALNRSFFKKNQPWLLIKPGSSVFWLGPLFNSSQTGCWACLAQRLKIRRRLDQLFQPDLTVFTPVVPPLLSFSLSLETAFNLLTIQILQWILHGENKLLTKHLVTFDNYNLEKETHYFTKRPQCPVCGDSAWITNRNQQPLILESQSKVLQSSEYRLIPPEATIAKYRHHISKLTGVVELLEKVYSDPTYQLIHIYTSGTNVNFQVKSYNELRSLLQYKDLGKGATVIQAQTSALCEGIERYSSSYHGDEYHIKARYIDLKDKAIHPYTCLNFSQNQYQQAQSWNSQPERIELNLVPPSFDDTKEIAWTPVWSLTTQTFKYLPTAYCYYGYPEAGPSPTPPCSNGNAAGNSLEEAILQGFAELVERDSVCLWWYNCLKRPGVDLSSFENPYIKKIIACYQTLGRNLWVLDITADLNIPTFVAISARKNSLREDILYGFGSHFDAQVAIIKAITEMNQILSFFLRIKEGELPQGNGEALVWWQTATTQNQPYLLPQKDVPLKSYATYLRDKHNNLQDAVSHCVQIASAQGLETLVLDQTQPDVGLNVVKVIVPGLRHFWRRLGPGRLYDVPVKLGWLNKPLKEDELNPFSIFL